MQKFLRHKDGDIFKVEDVRSRLTEEERTVGPVKVKVPVIKLETLSGKEIPRPQSAPKPDPVKTPPQPTPAAPPIDPPAPTTGSPLK
jgi:hypothetical protein